MVEGLHFINLIRLFNLDAKRKWKLERLESINDIYIYI